MAELKLVNVSKSYGSTTVIHGVDLEVRNGEFVVFVGPSGCGKSTLLRIIAGLDEATCGDILIDGHSVVESNLDAELRVATRRELAGLRAAIGGTMNYVTHDQAEAMTLADRIVVLNAGRIEQAGTPLDL